MNPQPNSPSKFVKAWSTLKRKYALHLRGGWEQGGYVHDTAMSQWIPPRACFFQVGTWTDTVGATAGTHMVRKTAAANSGIVVIPILTPQNSVALKGSLIKSIDVWYEITTAAATSVTALITTVALPADVTAFPAVAAPAFTYDTGHDTAAERLAVQKHKMTLSITTPAWLDYNTEMYVDITDVDPGTQVFDFYGARVNYTFRI